MELCGKLGVDPHVAERLTPAEFFVYCEGCSERLQNQTRLVANILSSIAGLGGRKVSADEIMGLRNPELFDGHEDARADKVAAVKAKLVEQRAKAFAEWAPSGILEDED